MPERKRDIGASVRARLLNLARERGQALEALLTRYALERLLHRLSLSPHRSRFVLKGAMLVTTWIDAPSRVTRDVDFLGTGDPAPDALVSAFREIFAVELEDGMAFDQGALRVEAIREEVDYGGVRLRSIAVLGGARIPITIDIGFGDATVPGVEDIDLPVLLDMPAPHLRAYSPETVVAEKFQAMVVLGRANSRMKDFFDVWMLFETGRVEDVGLASALAATFGRRRTLLPVGVPDALSTQFHEDPVKQRQWRAFAEQVGQACPPLQQVIETLRRRLVPVVAKARALAP